jgi:hypothetical protein
MPKTFLGGKIKSCFSQHRIVVANCKSV